MDVQETDRKEITALRDDALVYFSPNGLGNDVLEHMEDAANNLFYDNPEDINAYLSCYFENLALRPALSQIHGRFIISCNGLPTLEIDVYCKIKNTIKLISTLSSPNTYNSIADYDKAFINAEKSIFIVDEILSKKFFDCCPFNQLAFDDELREIFHKFEMEYIEIKQNEKEMQQEEKDTEVASDTESITSKKTNVKNKKTESKANAGKSKNAAVPVAAVKPKDQNTSILENIMPGLTCKSAVSQSLCHASSIMQDIPLYKYISNYYNVGVTSPFTIPIPMISLLNNSINYVKEILVIPSPNMSLHKVTVALSKIISLWQNEKSFQSNVTEVSTKSVGKESRSTGALSGKVAGGDKLEELLENIKECIKKAGFTLNEDFYIGLNCASQNCYQKDSNTYEMFPGTSKSPKDLRKFWLKVKSQYPSVICIIDPFHKSNTEEWAKLCGEISSSTYVIGHDVFSVSSKLNHEVPDYSFSSSGIMLKFDDSSTVSDLWKSAFKLKDNHQLICMSSSEEDTCSTFCVDMAVALRAVFIKIGVMNKLEKSLKLQRLIQIYDELSTQNLAIDTSGPFTFHQVGSVYKESEEVEHDSDTDSKKGKSGTHKKSPNRSVVKN